MHYDCLREPGKYLSAPNELSLERPGDRIAPHFTLGLNGAEGSASILVRRPARSFQSEVHNSPEMRRHADATLRLQRISTLLIREGSNGGLYDHVLDAAIDLMSADMGSMQAFHPERGELRLLAEKGFNPGSAAHWKWVRPDTPSPCGMALSAGCRVIWPDIETCEGLGRGVIPMPFVWRAACLSTPLMARSGRLLGMISTHWRKPHRPSEHELQPLDVLARQAAGLIERSEVEKTLRESREQFRWLASIVESSDDAIVGKNLDGIITSWNKGAERVFGYLAEDIIGKSITILPAGASRRGANNSRAHRAR